ncbi:helix-turn-helix transcriptional regulator [Microbacterium sp.]|uniref:helix-turn-helix domain-containing protein n=1 Tax=Microbacterium sp. TaxID=51671 RepID=UPI0033427862
MARTPSPAAALVGTNIRELRQQRSYSPDDLASMTKIDSSNIRAYEAGRSLIGLHSLVKVATALGVEPGRLLDGLELSMFEKQS